MSEFKIGDRVKIVVPTGDTLQTSYFNGWKRSPVGMEGTINYDQGETSVGHWWSILLDEQVETNTGATYSILGFPANELELIPVSKAETMWLIYHSHNSFIEIIGPWKTEAEAKEYAEHLQLQSSDKHVWFGPVEMTHA